MYRIGLFHRDWMDIFLFHIALDETLIPALSVLVLLWITLLVGYFWLLVSKTRFGLDNAQKHAKVVLSNGREHQLRLFYVMSGAILIALAVSGLVTERSIVATPVRIGQRAANFALPSVEGSREPLSLAQGHVVLLAFVPSVLCDFCRKQLQTFQELLPELQTHDIVLFVVSTDTSAVQRIVAQSLHLDYPLLSEAPSMNQHPAGSAYGVYHLPQQDTGPVDANSIIVIDAKGIVRAVSILPNRPITATEIRSLTDTALGPIGVKKSMMNVY
jgi:peroxiredoxin